MTEATAELQESFEQYKKACLEHEKLVELQEADLAPLKIQVAMIKETYEDEIRHARLKKSSLRSTLVEAAQYAKLDGQFGDKARMLLRGGYVEAQTPKKEIEVSDTKTFLTWPFAYLAVEKVVLDQEVIQILHRRGGIPGITVTMHLPVVKISIKGGL